ncbi:MAG: flagellin [Pseudomonadota bacterium]
MAQYINTNIASLNAQRNLNASQASLQTSLQRLSSGLRINSAKDDASGLSVATGMTSTINGQQVAMRNANDAISLSQVAEGAIGKITDALQRMRDLAVQAANATSSGANLQTEFTALGSEILRLAGGTTFNGQAILGANAGTMTFQIGAGTTTNDSIAVTTTRLDNNATITAVTGALAGSSVSITTTTLASTAIGLIDTALSLVTTERANYGALQNRFEAVISNLQVSVENQTAARSRIMDADFAAETASMTRAQILQQAGTAMLAQANQLPNGVLSLLK